VKFQTLGGNHSRRSSHSGGAAVIPGEVLQQSNLALLSRHPVQVLHMPVTYPSCLGRTVLEIGKYDDYFYNSQQLHSCAIHIKRYEALVSVDELTWGL